MKSLKKRRRPTLGLGAGLIGKEETRLVLDVLRRQEPFRYYGHGAKPPPMAARLERELRQKLGVKFVLGVANGTAALEVALGALGIGPGDEVIVPAWSWISCFTSVVRVGALPVLAEIDETLCLAPGEITRLCTLRTKAAMVIHYQGVAAELNPILAEAREAGLAVIEDCAESPGALYHGQRVGSIGTIGTFSFQFHKSMTSGEGGAVATNDPVLYERAVRMHDIGQFRAYHHQFVKPQGPAFCGSQFRLTELQAALALAQLRKLDGIRRHCRRLQTRVRRRIGTLPGLEFRTIPDPAGDSGFEIYLLLRTPELAEQFRDRLNRWNVNCQQMTGTYCHYGREYCQQRGVHAPGGSPFAGFEQWPAPGYRAQDFPRTEGLIHRFVALPLGVQYTEADADYIGAVVRRVHTELGIG